LSQIKPLKIKSNQYPAKFDQAAQKDKTPMWFNLYHASVAFRLKLLPLAIYYNIPSEDSGFHPIFKMKSGQGRRYDAICFPVQLLAVIMRVLDHDEKIR